MKNLLKIASLFPLLLLIACSSESTSSSANAPQASTPEAPAPEQVPLLSQEAPVVRVVFPSSGTENVATYLVNSKNIDKEKIETGGLTKLEAHIAKMMAMTSGKCAQAESEISFALINNENRLVGRYDLPCAYVRKVYRTIGVGPNSEYPTIRGSNTEIISTNQLAISANNLASFKNIVGGLEPKEYKGTKIGEVLK